jgi:hypothetical protein
MAFEICLAYWEFLLVLLRCDKFYSMEQSIPDKLLFSYWYRQYYGVASGATRIMQYTVVLDSAVSDDSCVRILRHETPVLP